MAWTMTPTNGSTFQTLEELRLHLKSTTENDKDVPEDLLPSPHEQVKKSAKKTKTKKSQKSEDDSEVDVEPSPELNAQEDTYETEEEFSDLKLVLDAIIKDIKKINTRVSAVATVLEDIQAATVTRHYSSLNKVVSVLKSITEDGYQCVNRKKQRVVKNKAK